MDYMDKVDFSEALKAGKFVHENVDVIFHEGACSDTMEYNGKYMMQNNFEYTKNLMHFAVDRFMRRRLPLTAAVQTDFVKSLPVRKL